MANGYAVDDVAALRAYDVTATPVIKALLVIQHNAWYQWDPAGDNITYADNGEWLIHSTGNNGLWYTSQEIFGTTNPSGAQPYPVRYGELITGTTPSGIVFLHRNPGGGSVDWTDFPTPGA